MKTPKYISELLRTKKQRQLFSQHPEFCHPVISSLRFLVTVHDFRLHEIEKRRHELWVAFRKPLPIPIRMPRIHDTYVSVVVETEYFNSTNGEVALWSERRLIHPLRSFSFQQLDHHYGTDNENTNPQPGLRFAQQMRLIKQTTGLMQANWDDLILRLTRNIRRSSITG